MRIVYLKENFGKLIITVLKCLSFVTAVYLIYKEIYNYTIVKPTSIEKTTKTMSQEFIPQMLFCPKPGISLDVVNELGYAGNQFLTDIFVQKQKQLK